MEKIKNYEAIVKLNLSDDEREKISNSADALQESFSQLLKINTDGIEPCYTVLNISNVFREDISTQLISREELLSNAPMQEEGFFQVPKTI
jgi:aspartyl-tRNA(Asn)/glutamyl-tRNA(Gln) amidotransferase subunit C